MKKIFIVYVRERAEAEECVDVQLIYGFDYKAAIEAVRIKLLLSGDYKSHYHLSSASVESMAKLLKTDFAHIVYCKKT